MVGALRGRCGQRSKGFNWKAIDLSLLFAISCLLAGVAGQSLRGAITACPQLGVSWRCLQLHMQVIAIAYQSLAAQVGMWSVLLAAAWIADMSAKGRLAVIGKINR